MDFSAVLKPPTRTSFTLASVMLLAGHAACGGLGVRGANEPTVDAPVAPVWSPDISTTSCEDYATVSVGSYVVQSNYWNKATCPGTQCIQINNVTGAYAITQSAPPCGDKVSSYPNVLYGCAYGNCSPATMLPMPITALSKVTSSWDWAVGGGPADSWNVAYELWFCPDNNCGSTGFPNGLELMIWLDYKSARGFKDHVGTSKLSGHDWDVWEAPPGILAAGSQIESWTYMDYIIKGTTVSSVTELDLNAFIQDAVNRGYAQSSWYLYSIQAGMEVRTGGMPFISNKFLVSINGVTPTHAPLPITGLSCDGGAPSADGQLTVDGTYVTAGPLHGYAAAWTAVGSGGSTAKACVTPVCTAGQEGGVGTCSPAFGPSSLCMAGAIEADTTYHATAGLGFMLNQDVLATGSASDPDGGGIPTVGTITVPNSVTVGLTKSGNFPGNTALRLQLTDVDGNIFCYGGPLNEVIPIGKLNTMCWNNTGDYATSSTRFTRLDVIVPSSAASEQDFAYCLTSFSVQ